MTPKEKREAVVRAWPRYMPKQWRDRGTLRHFVMVFDDGETMVLSKWWSKKRGWQYECERFEMVRMQISLEVGKNLRDSGSQDR